MSSELRSLIRDTIAEYPKADPRELACHVAKATDEADLISFYTETLVDYVAAELRTARNKALNHAMSNRRGNYPSPKLQDRGDWWAEMLKSLVHVGKTQWKPLGDCTSKDLQFCAQEREQDVTRIQEQVAHYRRLDQLLTDFHVTLVRELPPEAVLNS